MLAYKADVGTHESFMDIKIQTFGYNNMRDSNSHINFSIIVDNMSE